MTHSFGFNPEIKPLNIASQVDPRIVLYIDRVNTMYWLDFPEDASYREIALMLDLARSRGFIEAPGEDDYDMDVDMGDSRRLYLRTTETLPDIPLQRTSMPDLAVTAYGPMSGQMEAVVM